MKTKLVNALFRHRWLRAVAFAVRRRPDVSHLVLYKDTVLGPVQRDEALLLHGILLVTRPKTVVEFGFLRGHSALTLLTALDDDARLYSFDIEPESERWARERFGHDPRLRFATKSQTEIAAEDVDGRPVDFVFLDAAHELELNQRTLERLLPLLAPDAMVAVHDTGTVPRGLFPAGHPLLVTDEGWVADEYEGRPGERAFVNWLREAHPEFAQVNFHSRTVIRCGITLLQRSGPLARSADADDARAAEVA